MSVPGRPRSARARTTPSAAPAGSAYDAAVRYLGPRPRSVLEVRRHLAKKRHDEKAIASAIERLREQGFMDDRAFARYWLEQRARFRPRGELGLMSELRAKGVDRAIVDEVLSESERDEVATARAALEPRLPRWRDLDGRDRKLKAQAFLRQRGFGYETIAEVTARL